VGADHLETVDALHSLVFGVLALQTGFVRREHLRAAVSAWELDKSHTLAGWTRSTLPIAAIATFIAQPKVDGRIALFGIGKLLFET
jgi:hypothetical protein